MCLNGTGVDLIGISLFERGGRVVEYDFRSMDGGSGADG